jgi:hypothetical protein
MGRMPVLYAENVALIGRGHYKVLKSQRKVDHPVSEVKLLCNLVNHVQDSDPVILIQCDFDVLPAQLFVDNVTKHHCAIPASAGQNRTIDRPCDVED